MNILTIILVLGLNFIQCLLSQNICTINLLSVKDNEVLNHQLVLIRGQIFCPNAKSTYPNNVDSKLGRFMKFKIDSATETSWPVNSYNEFKATLRLKYGLNRISISYLYENEIANSLVNLRFEENKFQRAINLGIFVAKDSPRTFQIDAESKEKGEKNDLDSAIKRVGTGIIYMKILVYNTLIIITAGLLWQAFTSDIFNLNGLKRNVFRLALDSNNG
jgi:hypothetical protein